MAEAKEFMELIMINMIFMGSSGMTRHSEISMIGRQSGSVIGIGKHRTI